MFSYVEQYRTLMFSILIQVVFFTLPLGLFLTMFNNTPFSQHFGTYNFLTDPYIHAKFFLKYNTRRSPTKTLTNKIYSTKIFPSQFDAFQHQTL